MASEFAALLRTHRDLTSDALEWFTHHSEVDIEHAEQGLDAIEQYVEYYQLDQKEAADIIDSALQENIYIKYYFGSRAAADANVGSSLGHSAS
jgi:pyrroloquinoline quinone (PQQ) biosynthesis protein C